MLEVLHRKGLVSDAELAQATMQVNKHKKAQNTHNRREAIRSNDYLLFNRSITREQWMANNREIEREYGS